MITADEARKTSKEYMNKVLRDHEAERKEIIAKEDALTHALWEEREPALIAQIEGYIQRAAAKGDLSTWEPNKSNPDGSSVLYLNDGDAPMKSLLVNYLRGNGYTVVEYLYDGIKITW